MQAIGLPYEGYDLDQTFSVLAGCKNLKHIFVNSSTTDTLPSSVSQIENLEYLDCFDWVNLKELPEDISKLRKLKAIDLGMDLNIGWNMALELPESLGDLQNLEYISLMDRMDVSLPKSFSKLMKLRFLDLCYSGIIGFPLEKEQCKNLEILHINIQGVDVFPENYYYALNNDDITQYGLRDIFPKLTSLLCNSNSYYSRKGNNANVNFESYFNNEM